MKRKYCGRYYQSDTFYQTSFLIPCFTWLAYFLLILGIGEQLRPNSSTNGYVCYQISLEIQNSLKVYALCICARMCERDGERVHLRYSDNIAWYIHFLTSPYCSLKVHPILSSIYKGSWHLPLRSTKNKNILQLSILRWKSHLKLDKEEKPLQIQQNLHINLKIKDGPFQKRFPCKSPKGEYIFQAQLPTSFGSQSMINVFCMN